MIHPLPLVGLIGALVDWGRENLNDPPTAVGGILFTTLNTTHGNGWIVQITST